MTAQQMKETVCSKFQKQLSDLVSILQRSQRKYIRCIKPNDQKRKLLFENEHSLEQVVVLRPFHVDSLQRHFRGREDPKAGLSLPSDAQAGQSPPFLRHVVCPSVQVSGRREEPKLDHRSHEREGPDCRHRENATRVRRRHLLRALAGTLSRTGASHSGAGSQSLYACLCSITVALDELLPRVQSVVKCKLATIGLPLYVKVEEAIRVVAGGWINR